MGEETAKKAGEVTALLVQARDGNRNAMERLLPLLYGELRRLARRQLTGERPAHTLGVSGLVNEAYLKLVDQVQVDWQDRQHFYAIAARAMRQVLVDYARRRNAEKRAAERNRTSIGDKQLPVAPKIDDLLALDQALDKIDQIDTRLRQVVEYRYLCGLSTEETAEILGVTTRTVERDWVKARALLYRHLYPGKK